MSDSATTAETATRQLSLSFHPKQREALAALLRHQFVLYGGARGGGKSHLLRWWLWLYLMARRVDTPGISIGLFCESYPALKDRQMAAIQKEFPREWGELRDDKARGLGWHLHDRTGSILLRNLDDPSKYQSTQFAAIGVDELTKIGKPQFDLLRGSLRWPGISKPRFVGTANPGGVGMAWVKQIWIDRVFPQELAPLASEFAFVKALPSDNPTLPESYWQMLDTLPPMLARAWRHGDWDAFSGQMFAFYEPVHVVPEHVPPAGAPLLMTMDWGFGAPYSIGWWYVTEDKRLIRFSEIYGAEVGDDTKGLRQSDDEVADVITRHEESHWIDGNRVVRYAGPDCFQKRPDYRGGGQGPSTAEVYARHGLTLLPGDPDRKARVRAFHARLAYEKGADGSVRTLPGLQVTANCRAFIRLIPTLQPAEHDPEDVDTDMPDHVYDEACHAVMARLPAGRGPGAAGMAGDSVGRAARVGLFASVKAGGVK